tara:strand:+ start:1732 stop:4218 length:2487 start_codon:yes stop_codon:yes gene_type:complete
MLAPINPFNLSAECRKYQTLKVFHINGQVSEIRLKSTMNFVRVFILVFCSTYLSLQTHAQSQSPQTTSWPDSIFTRISRDYSDDWADQTTRLSVSLFDELADIELFSVGNSRVDVSTNIRRQVFDNRDLLETYTVADTFKLPMRIGLWDQSDIPFPGATLGAGLGIELYFQGVNLRQVKAKDISSLEAAPSDIENRLRNLRRARYGKWWNALIIPLRLPFTEKNVERMDVGEISSWLLGGTLRLDGSFGWGDLGILGADFLEINSGFTTYLAGTFKVSALKLEKQKIRLKFARERKHGVAIGLGQSRMEYTLFDGFMVFGQNALGIQESIVPFSFQTSTETAKGFDVVYDYDLSNEDAKRAYFLATQGRLEESNKLSLVKDSGVTPVMRRDYHTDRNLRRSQMKLSLVFKKQSVESWSLTQAKVTTNDRVFTVFESKNINVRGFDSLWGSREEKRYELTSALEEDGSWLTNKHVLQIKMNASDSDMSGKELNSIISETQEISGIDLKLPVFPQSVPCRRCSAKNERPAWYGPVKAAVQVDLPGSSLASFLSTPEEEYWPLLEVAHGVPVGQWGMKTDRFWWTVERMILTVGNIPLFLADVHMKPGGKLWNAWRLRRNWKRAAAQFRENKSKLLAKRLGKLFKHRHYNREMTRLLTLGMEPDPSIPTLVDLSAPESFGRIRKITGELPISDLSVLIRRDLDFDMPGPNLDYDPAMTFKEAKIKRQEDGSIVLEFKLDQTASFLHWHIEKRQSFGRRTTVLKRIKPLLDDQVGPGEVSFIFTKDDTDPYNQTIFEALNQDFPLAIRLSSSRNGNDWGEITELHLDPIDLR